MQKKNESGKTKKFDRNVALVTFFLAFVLWAWVTLIKVYVFEIPLPLRPVSLPMDLVLQERLPDSVYVKVKGTGKSFMKLYFSSPSFRLNLSGIKKSKTLELRRRIEDIDFPGEKDLQILEVLRPQVLEIKFSKKLVKKLSVKPDIHFSVEPGYIWVDTKIIPDSVTLSGATDAIKGFSEIITRRVEYIRPLSHSIERTVALKIPVNSNISVTPQKVKIVVDIQRLAENVIHDVPIRVINVPKNKTAISLPPTLTITLKGGDKILAKVKKEDISAFINYETDYVNNLKRYNVNINIRENVDIISYEPRYFDLLIKKK